MIQEKSLQEQDLEAYKKMFQEAGDFVDSSTIFDLWQMIPKKESILKGELNVTKTDKTSSTYNILINSLELISLGNRFYLYWLFGEKNTNMFLISKPQNPKGLETLSKLFNQIIMTFEAQVQDLFSSGIKLYNDFIIMDYKFFDIVDFLERKERYFSSHSFEFKTNEQEKRSLQLFGDCIDVDVMLGLFKKYERKQFFELMKFRDNYESNFRKVVFSLNEYLGTLPEEKFKKVDIQVLFKERLEQAGIYYPFEEERK